MILFAWCWETDDDNRLWRCYRDQPIFYLRSGSEPFVPSFYMDRFTKHLFFFHSRRELQYMLFNRRKAEIEILSSLSVDNGTDDIPDMPKSANKRSTADWLFPDEIKNLNQPQEQNISHEGLGTADFTQPLGFLSSELILSSICLLPAITALAMAAVNSHEYERSTCRAKATHRGDRVRQLGSKCFYWTGGWHLIISSPW